MFFVIKKAFDKNKQILNNRKIKKNLGITIQFYIRCDQIQENKDTNTKTQHQKADTQPKNQSCLGREGNSN